MAGVDLVPARLKRAEAHGALQFRAPPPAPPASWDDVDTRLAAVAPLGSLAVVELAPDGTPTAHADVSGG